MGGAPESRVSDEWTAVLGLGQRGLNWTPSNQWTLTATCTIEWLDRKTPQDGVNFVRPQRLTGNPTRTTDRVRTTVNYAPTKPTGPLLSTQQCCMFYWLVVVETAYGSYFAIASTSRSWQLLLANVYGMLVPWYSTIVGRPLPFWRPHGVFIFSELRYWHRIFVCLHCNPHVGILWVKGPSIYATCLV